MKAFWDRCRARAWTSADVDRISNVVLFPYLTGSMLVLWTLDTEVGGDPKDASFWTVFTVIAVLSGSATWWVLAHARPEIPLGSGKLRRALTSLVFGAFYGWLGGTYGYLLNAVTGSFETVVLEGPIVHLERTTGGYAGMSRLVTFTVGARTVTFSETAERFDSLQVSDIYRTEARLGGFGYYWRPGRAHWKGAVHSVRARLALRVCSAKLYRYCLGIANIGPIARADPGRDA